MAFVLPGCLAGGAGGAAEDSVGVVVSHEGAGDVVLTSGTGGIMGTIRDDIGVPVPTVHVALLKTDFSTYSNRTGKFQILNVTAGKHVMRVDHPDYRASEASIEVKAGEITTLQLTLLPKADVGVGYRPHLHDYWGDKTEAVVMDKSWEWHEPYDDNGPYSQTFGRYYDTSTLILVHPCVWTDKKDEVYFNQRQVWFDDEAQLVWAGTSKIIVTLTWTQQDYIHDELAFAWRSADTNRYEESPMIKKGVPYEIAVEPRMWDSGHQSYTLWDFWVCTGGATLDNARPYLGNIHVNMKLIRGHEIVAERAHPYFWENGTEIPVVKRVEKKFAAGAYSVSRNGVNPGNFGILLEEGVLIPPGTGKLRATVEWKYSQAVNNAAWSLTYKAANVHPLKVADPGKYSKPTATERGTASRTYEFDLKPGETDAFYQTKSNWKFMINVEGEEGDWKYVNGCPCDLSVFVTVTAIEDPKFEAPEETKA
ncbi:MAG: carboxypeptidase regulatory-like domain-containing protein [Euryarchaeota archaeon]|nr:carboxypeptidase regulatory-like domain-containing protein [Euryarchaeota archaeon]